MYKQMMTTLILDLTIFFVIYLLNFCVLKPTGLYDK